MRKAIVGFLLVLLAGLLPAAERKFDFSETPTNQPPPGCVSTVAGEGKPGVWKVIMDEVPLDPTPFASNAVAKKSLVAQLARDTTDEHFPMLILGEESYGDFTLKTRFKLVDGATEQMAGIAFRIQDEKNFYCVRASALGGTFYFYTVKNGVRTRPIGNSVKFEKGVWHDLAIQCEATKIHILLDGKEAMPTLDDPTFSAGKVAYWTKSDSVSYFADTSVSFTPKESFAQRMVHDTMKVYPRLLGLQVSVISPKTYKPTLVGSNDDKEIGQPGEKTDADVIKRGVNYYRKEKEMVVITVPLCDRNGDPLAAVRVSMKTFPGQTEENAYVRALPIIKTMQQQAAMVTSLAD